MTGGAAEIGQQVMGTVMNYELWTVDGGSWHCTGDREQDHPQEKEMQKSKMAVWAGLTNGCKIRKAKEKRKDIPIWMQSSKE